MDSYCGHECEVEALGQQWRFARWSWKILDAWTDWARTQLPNPIKLCMAAIEEYMAEEAKITDPELIARRNKIKDEMAAAAMKQAGSYQSFLAPEIQSVANSPQGAARLATLLLKPHHPEINDDKSLEIIKALGPAEMQRIMRITAGRPLPEVGNGEAPVALSLASRGQ